MVGLFVNLGIAKGLVNTIRNYLNSIIDSIDDDIVVIDINCGKKIESLLFRNDVKYRHIYWEEDKNYNWLEYKKNIEENIQDLDSFIILGSSLARNYNSKDQGLVEYYDKAIENGNITYGIKYIQTRAMYQRYLICKCCKDKKLVYVCLDPQECVLTKYFNSGVSAYILNKDDLKYVPSYERYLFKKKYSLFKTDDFTFYATALTLDRQWLVDATNDLNLIRNSDIGIIVKKDANYINQKDYYVKLAQSKFTLIIPSYDVTTFSIIRFLEAVSNYCLPLVLDTVDLTDLKNTFPDIYEIVNEYLIVKIDGIQNAIDSLDYEEILNKIYATQSIKNFMNDEYFKKAWKEII